MCTWLRRVGEPHLTAKPGCGTWQTQQSPLTAASLPEDAFWAAAQFRAEHAAGEGGTQLAGQVNAIPSKGKSKNVQPKGKEEKAEKPCLIAATLRLH